MNIPLWVKIALFTIPSEMFDGIVRLVDIQNNRYVILDIDRAWDGRTVIRLLPQNTVSDQVWIWNCETDTLKRVA